MTTLIAYHRIDDAEHWLASPKREELLGPLGIGVRTFVDQEDPTRAAVLFEIPDLDAFRELLASEAAAAAMAHDGVHPDTIVLLVES